MRRLLTEPSFQTAAGQWAIRISRCRTREIFPRILRRWFAEPAHVVPAAAVNATADLPRTHQYVHTA
jgi:hypothetical protein